MTIGVVSRKKAYTGDGVTSSFTVPFQFYDIAVYINGVRISPSLYTTSQPGIGTTGTLTFTPGNTPAYGASLLIVAETAILQSVDYIENDAFPAETTERIADRLTMIAQELAAALSKAVRFGATAADLPTLNPTSLDQKLLVGSATAGIAAYAPPKAGLVGVSAVGVPYISEQWLAPETISVTRETYQGDTFSAPSFVPGGGGGAWASVPFSASNFSGGDTMTWTVEAGDVVDFSYSMSGTTMTVAFVINDSVVGGTSARDLLIKIPGGRSAARVTCNAVFGADPSYYGAVFAFTNAGSQYIQIRKLGSTDNWAAGSTFTYGQISFEVTP